MPRSRLLHVGCRADRGAALLCAQTRQKLKEAYEAEFAATIERAEKQIILAKHGRRLLALLDDTPVVPGDDPRPYASGQQARQVLNDCEDDLREWQPDQEAYALDDGPHAPAKGKEPALGEGETIRGDGSVAGTDGAKSAEAAA